MSQETVDGIFNGFAGVDQTSTVADLVVKHLLAGPFPEHAAEVSLYPAPVRSFLASAIDAGKNPSRSVEQMSLSSYDKLLSAILRKSFRERRQAFESLSQQFGDDDSIINSMYFSTLSNEGAEQVTRVDWIKNQEPRIPRIKNLLDSHFLRHFIVARPRMRIWNVGTSIFDTADSQTVVPVRGYSVGHVDSVSEGRGVIKVEGYGVAYADDESLRAPALSPYFYVDEDSVIASNDSPSIFGKKKRVTNIGSESAVGDDNPDVDDFVSLLQQLVPANVIVGAGLGTQTIKEVEDVLRAGSLGDMALLLIKLV